MTPFHSLAALVLGLLGLGGSTLHLGRPLEAWRCFAGLRTSWLSREIMVFGVFAALALICAGSFWLPALNNFASVPFVPELSSLSAQNALAIAVSVSGLAGVFCSVMIYRDTRRTFWRTRITAPKFIGTMLLLGPAAILFTTIVQSVLTPVVLSQTVFRHVVNSLCEFLAVATAIKLLWELVLFAHLSDRDWTDMKRTALLMSGVLKRASITRFVCGAVGGIILPILVVLGTIPLVMAIVILPSVLLGELLERFLFFTAVILQKMPGGIAS
jgi:formate dehydrogenase iron-sulfur subunit